MQSADKVLQEKVEDLRETNKLLSINAERSDFHSEHLHDFAFVRRCAARKRRVRRVDQSRRVRGTREERVGSEEFTGHRRSPRVNRKSHRNGHSGHYNFCICSDRSSTFSSLSFICLPRLNCVHGANLAAPSRAPLFTRVKIQMSGALLGPVNSASRWKNDAPFCQPHVLQFMGKDFTGGGEIQSSSSIERVSSFSQAVMLYPRSSYLTIHPSIAKSF